ncbi:MAG TPA: cytochrome c peroxidase [Pseudobdellovibrionaceae bacterium]|nr:cytochrome c peroxidase [Pseudobdellovibrionaceae bacterium]
MLWQIGGKILNDGLQFGARFGDLRKQINLPQCHRKLGLVFAAALVSWLGMSGDLALGARPLDSNTRNSKSWKVVETLPWAWRDHSAPLSRLKFEDVELGELLFFDPQLSGNLKQSCATCHDPRRGFSNAQAVATGARGQRGQYNVPVIFNRVHGDLQFWDARGVNLKSMITSPVTSPLEMAADLDVVLERLNRSATYKSFGLMTKDRLEIALASFLQSLITADSRFDLSQNGHPELLSEREQQGKDLFFNTYKCQSCHSGVNFSSETLQPRCGTPMNQAQVSSTGDAAQVNYGNWLKVPTLRNLKQSAPYLHSGRLRSIDEVLEFYNSVDRPLPKSHRRLLAEFLRTLESEVVQFKPRPKAP